MAIYCTFCEEELSGLSLEVRAAHASKCYAKYREELQQIEDEDQEAHELELISDLIDQYILSCREQE